MWQWRKILKYFWYHYISIYNFLIIQQTFIFCKYVHFILIKSYYLVYNRTNILGWFKSLPHFLPHHIINISQNQSSFTPHLKILVLFETRDFIEYLRERNNFFGFVFKVKHYREQKIRSNLGILRFLFPKIQTQKTVFIVQYDTIIDDSMCRKWFSLLRAINFNLYHVGCTMFWTSQWR